MWCTSFNSDGLMLTLFYSEKKIAPMIWSKGRWFLITLILIPKKRLISGMRKFLKFRQNVFRFLVGEFQVYPQPIHIHIFIPYQFAA